MKKMQKIKDIAEEVADIVDKKNKDYDKAFEKTFNEYGPVTYCLRVKDKLNRFHALTVKEQTQQVNDESIIDTLTDIIGYSLLTLEIYKRGEGSAEKRD